MGGVETSDDVERPGIDRRTLIKGAAAAGAVAWTAPVIIDSLASPAAAATAATGCFGIQYPLNGTTGACAAAATLTTGCCQPANFTTHTNFTTQTGCTVSVTGNCGSTTGTTVFTITNACSCVFTQGTIQNNSGICFSGTIGGSGKTMTFTTSRCVATTTAFRMLISCGGATCVGAPTSCGDCD